MTIVGEVTFTGREIERFAALTLDRNPIHMDPRTAQRSFAGARVVHGMHVLLTALELFVVGRRESPGFKRVRCEFRHPILIDERARFEYRQRSGAGVRLSALVDELSCAEIRLDDGPASGADQGAPEPIRIDERLDAIGDPLDQGPREMAAFGGTISTAAAAAVTEMYPRLCAAIGPSNVSALARLSYLVGMLCPGLHSVFSSLDVTLASRDAARGFSTFAVTAVDERFSLVQIALLAGDLMGTLSAFQRPSAFQQPTVESLTDRVRAGEFAGARALVIGGSRGLGELTAKLLCAGGGAVTLTYARGRSEAHLVSTEIMAANRGVCTPLELDILAPLSGEVLRLLGRVDLVFYFPTPMIFRKKSRTFSAAILQDFLRFYVERFHALCEAVEAAATQPVRIFYPSSIAVDSRPKGMTEYAMAKAAGEVLIADLNAASSKIQIVSSRLPRMGSDQTNTIAVSAEEADSVAIMLSLIRSMWPF